MRARDLAALALALLCAASGAHGATISNTGNATFLVGGVPAELVSNTVSLDSIPAPTPATLTILQHAPGLPAALTLPADGGQCWSGSAFAPLPAVTALAGGAIDLLGPELADAPYLHYGEPVFVRLADGNRNVSSVTREFVEVTLSASTGDEERLLLQETGPDTGVFVGAIQSQPLPPAAASFDCRISLEAEGLLRGDYTDVYYPADQADDEVLVDPYGTVFDSNNGLPVDGATVSLINDDTGQPAQVRGDDGVSSFPSTVTSGGTATDSSGAAYQFPPGGYRFPYVAPGNYRLVVTPPSGYAAPSAVPLEQLLLVRDPEGNPYAVVQGSRGERFGVQPGPAMNIDLPIDPVTFFLQKSVSHTEAAAGDFLQYRLVLHNQTAGAANNATITDVLPPGFRYQAGSLRVQGAPAADPAISADGRTLTVAAGTVPGNGSAEVSYVVEVGAGAAPGRAINTAVASAGTLTSNTAQAEVRVREALFSAGYTIVGRVVEGACDAPWDRLKGVGNVRLLLDNGTYVASDADGQFHFEGVRPGTRVVQLDLDTLPPHLEIAPCLRNSRFAGRSYSQFVDAQGGSLWRTDFYVRRKPPIEGTVGLAVSGRFDVPAVPPPRPGRTYTLRAQFETLDAALAPAGVAAVAELVDHLREIRIERLEVIGHTDSRRIHPGNAYADNYALSQARAQAVAAALTRELGLVPAQVQAAGRGPDEPLASNGTEEGMALNRRTEVIVHGAATALPRTGGALHYRVELDGDRVAVSGLKLGVLLPEGARYVPGSARLDGTLLPDAGAAAGHLDLELGDPGTRWRRVVELQAAVSPLHASCPAQGFTLKAYAQFDTPGHADQRTPVIESRLACPAELAAAGAPPADAATVTARAERLPVTVLQELDVRPVTRVRKRDAIVAEAAAAGAETDWLRGREPGLEWLFPGPGHNPRAPAVRVAIKHAPGAAVALTLEGEPVSALSFDGTQLSADQRVAVSVWRGVALREGANHFVAEVRDAQGTPAGTLRRTVHYANAPARVEWVPDESQLVADGRTRPVIAVQVFDRFGHPVRAGVSVPFNVVRGPQAAERLEAMQERALAGMDRVEPVARVEGDEGIAYVELEPTTESGTIAVRFSFSEPHGPARQQELTAWLEPAAREWIMVGFAEGTVGRRKLEDNVQALAAQGVEEGAYTDGDVSFYAKGEILGKWLLTAAYDSGKPSSLLRRDGLFEAVIDPNRFYTLYGDGAQQRSDAPSQSRLYLKLERRQFYALFGDYDSGLIESQLARYSRRLNGIKSEYLGEKVRYTAYAAETAQRSARDEFQGDGTSGPYRLSQRNLVVNAERVRIETRDRLRSERIVGTRSLARHLDYDIDYAAGTLFFREPVNSRDFDFNPVFIVAEYETAGLAEPEQNAGGRVAMHLNQGKIVAGVSHVHDESNLGRTDLSGVDLKVRHGRSELRLEAAHSEGEVATVAPRGNAYLAEVEHRGPVSDSLIYVRRQDDGFGLNQQPASENGMQKIGADVQWRLARDFSLQTQAARQENLATEAIRDFGAARVEYRTDLSRASLGYQFAQDQAGALTARSEQATAAASRHFFDKALELTAGADVSLGNKNQSVDFPTRYTLGAAYALTSDVKLLLAQELTDGASYDTRTLRAGLQATPWQGGRLNSTLSQSAISEYGPRTFAQLGLTQAFLLGERWGLDLNADTSRALDRGAAPIVVNPNAPLAVGGVSGAGGLIEDYTALSGGLTYRAEDWSWNLRAEGRDGEFAQRYGLTTGFLQQARGGVAFSVGAQAFLSDEVTGADGRSARVNLGWAYRPLGARISLLDRLELRFDEVTGGTGTGIGSAAPLGTATVTGDARSRRIVNNFALNRVTRQWTGQEGDNPFTANERSQWSIYYGSKYVLDRFGDLDFTGYTDLVGLEARHDLTHWLDMGAQASVLHSWNSGTVSYSAGPSLGVAPVTNGWITLGYNVLGFHDSDFEAARYTAQGPYLKLRFKFDQNTRLPGWGNQ